MKELLKKENLEHIFNMREKAIDLRMKTQVELMNKMVAEKTVSPRTYENKKIELERLAT